VAGSRIAGRLGFCYYPSTSLDPRQPMEDPEREALERKLVELKTEHRDLDDVIARLSERQPFDQIQLQRLKKRKLQLKDLILQVESKLLPDIIA
jgi:hypothetical protein